MANQIRIIPIYSSAMQLRPTVDLMNEMVSRFQIAHRWWNIGKSLGISKGVMEKIRTTGSLPENHRSSCCDIQTRCIKAMLIKWLNIAKGTGHSERTWITIVKAIKDVGLGGVAFKLLEEGM